MASTARAQQPALRRVAMLGASRPTPEMHRMSLDPFREEMRARGWIEGSHYAIESRWAEGRVERYAQLAEELVRLDPDAIVTATNAQVIAVRKLTRTIPIVMVAATDPVRFGLISSYARPGGNVTGLSTDAGQTIIVKQLDFLRQILPGITRVGAIANAANRTHPAVLSELQVAARAQKLEILPLSVREAAELEPAFMRLKEQRAQALLVVLDGLFVLESVRIGALSAKHRLPTASGWPGIAQAGGLLSYATDFADLYRRAAGYVDRILKGAKPGELPVEQPTRFELIINRKAAQALGIDVPQAMLVRADRVIE